MDCGGVSTRGHGQREGPARYEFCDSGTKEIVGGSGVSDVNGVLRNPHHPPVKYIIKKRVTNQSSDFLVTLLFSSMKLYYLLPCLRMSS